MTKGFIKPETLRYRRDFIDYIYGLVRHEVHNGEDNDKRLEVLSKIHYDLLYREDLTTTDGWKRKSKDKDELSDALDQLAALKKKHKTVMDKLSTISDKQTKADIMEVIKSVQGK